MKKLLQFLFVALTGIQLAGGPYGLLQVYAWTGMLVNYSKTDGIARAVVDTFSGERPCELCCSIEQAKADDAKKGDSTPALDAVKKLRFDFVSPASTAVAEPKSEDEDVMEFVSPCLVRGLGGAAPPVPPPREMA